MASDGSIKIKITSDSDAVLRELQKVEQQARKTFDRAAASVRKTESEIAALEGRMREIANQKRAKLDIGVKWDPAALDAALDRTLAADNGFKSLQRRLDTLQTKWDMQTGAAKEASAAYEQASRSFAEASGSTSRAGALFGRLRGALSKVASGFMQTGKSARRAGDQVGKASKRMDGAKKAADPLAKSIKRLTNMFRLMLIRMVMRGAINAVRDGFADLAEYSNSFHDALSKISTAFLYVRNSLTVILKPAIEALAPMIDGMADAFARLADKAAQFSAALFGNSTTYTKAKKAAKEYGDATKKAAKEAERATTTFDDLNVLSFGKQAEVTGPTPDDMFDEGAVDKGVKSFAEKIRGAFEELKQYAADIGNVFKLSWAMEGTNTLDTLKATLGVILNLVWAVGRSFREVWTDGTGLVLLNTIQGLIQTILGIVSALATAFTNAWNTNNLGAQLVRAVLLALNDVIQAIISIGQAFIAAWNAGGLGQSIVSHILSIITGIANVVGSLAQRFTEAWNASGNGQAIMSAILGIINIILRTIDSIVQSTVEWARGLNLEPMISGIRAVLEPLVPIIAVIGQTIADMWASVVLPFLGWVIETAIPAVLNLLAKLLNAIAKHPEMIRAVTQAVVFFIAAWAVGKIIGGLAQMAQGFAKLLGNISPVNVMLTVLLGLIFMVTSAWNNMGPLERAIAVLGLLAVAAATVAIALHSIAGVGGVIMVVGAIAAGIAGATAAIWAANRARPASSSSGSGSAGRASAFSTQPFGALSSAPIPRLATGAVIPPNNEFLAVLGDQKRGTNIEAPLETIKQGLAEVLAAHGGGTGGEITLRIVTDGAVARAMKFEIDKQTSLSGVKLARGGAIR